jgi:hypothetical protein
VVDDPAGFLEAEPRAGLYLAALLAERLHAVNHLLAEARQRSADQALPPEALGRITRALQFTAPTR